MFPAALRDGERADPPYASSFGPKLNEAPLAPQGAARKRAAEQGEARQKRNAVYTPFLNAGQLALRCLRYIIAAEVAGVWQKPGGVGAAIMHLSH